MGNNMSNQHPQSSSPSGNVNSSQFRKKDADSTDNLLLKEWRQSQAANDDDNDPNKLSLRNPTSESGQVNRATVRKDTPAFQSREGSIEGNYVMRQRMSKGSLVLDKQDLRRAQFAPEKAFYGRSSLQSPITHKINGPYRVSSPIKVNSPMKRPQMRRPGLDEESHHPQSNHSSQSNSPIVRYNNNSSNNNGGGSSLSQQSIPVISLPGSSAN